MFEKLNEQKRARFEAYKKDQQLKAFAKRWLRKIIETEYGLNTTWLGVPALQSPIDLQMYQELIWTVKPDLIIETGVRFGGSIIFSASMLTLLEACGEIENGQVIGIDIRMPEQHKDSMFSRKLIDKAILITGSSTDPNVINQVKEIAKNKKRVMIFLDSNHFHRHVLAELRAYSPLVSVGSYIIVEDGFLEEIGMGRLKKGNNPRTAVWEFIKENKNFVIDKDIENRYIFVANVDGYLRRVK